MHELGRTDYVRIPAETSAHWAKRGGWFASAAGLRVHAENKAAALAKLAELIERTASEVSERSYLRCADGTVLVVEPGWYVIVGTSGHVSSCSVGETLSEERRPGEAPDTNLKVSAFPSVLSERSLCVVGLDVSGIKPQFGG